MPDKTESDMIRELYTTFNPGSGVKPPIERIFDEIKEVREQQCNAINNLPCQKHEGRINYLERKQAAQEGVSEERSKWVDIGKKALAPGGAIMALLALIWNAVSSK